MVVYSAEFWNISLIPPWNIPWLCKLRVCGIFHICMEQGSSCGGFTSISSEISSRVRFTASNSLHLLEVRLHFYINNKMLKQSDTLSRHCKTLPNKSNSQECEVHPNQRVINYSELVIYCSFPAEMHCVYHSVHSVHSLIPLFFPAISN